MQCAKQGNRLQRHLAAKFRVNVLISETVLDTQKKVSYKGIQNDRFSKRKHHPYSKVKNERGKMHIYLLHGFQNFNTTIWDPDT